MIYLRLVLSFIAALSGAACIGIAVLVYVQHDKPVVLYFSGFILALLLFLVGLSVPVFELIDNSISHTVSRTISFAIMSIAGILYLLVSPWFFHELTGSTVGRVRRVVYLAIAGLFAAVAVVVFVQPEWLAPQLVLNSLLFGMIGYAIAMLGIRMKRIGDKRLRRAVTIFFVLSAVFFPLMYLDSVSPFVTVPRWIAVLDDTALPSYFLLLNSLSIVLATGYFNEPPYVRNGVITDHFTGAFGLSNRELEIIQAAINGDSNKAIGEKLFISAKTVENHLYNTYQKTDVRNRVQLFNLILGNRAG